MGNLSQRNLPKLRKKSSTKMFIVVLFFFFKEKAGNNRNFQQPRQTAFPKFLWEQAHVRTFSVFFSLRLSFLSCKVIIPMILRCQWMDVLKKECLRACSQVWNKDRPRGQRSSWGGCFSGVLPSLGRVTRRELDTLFFPEASETQELAADVSSP